MKRRVHHTNHAAVHPVVGTKPHASRAESARESSSASGERLAAKESSQWHWELENLADDPAEPSVWPMRFDSVRHERSGRERDPSVSDVRNARPVEHNELPEPLSSESQEIDGGVSARPSQLPFRGELDPFDPFDPLEESEVGAGYLLRATESALPQLDDDFIEFTLASLPDADVDAYASEASLQASRDPDDVGWSSSDDHGEETDEPPAASVPTPSAPRVVRYARVRG